MIDVSVAFVTVAKTGDPPVGKDKMTAVGVGLLAGSGPVKLLPVNVKVFVAELIDTPVITGVGGGAAASNAAVDSKIDEGISTFRKIEKPFVRLNIKNPPIFELMRVLLVGQLLVVLGVP